MNYDQLLFSELRVAAVTPSGKPLAEEDMVKAMTVNEELLAVGYTLSPRDVITLAKSEDMDGFAARIREYAGSVDAKPMYPDFPNQVMNMDECVFRFHQLLHYLSTYGVEEITGISVTRGWLPEVQDTEKTQPDTRLLEAKVLGLIDSADKYFYPYKKILSVTERMDEKQKMMIAECVKHLTPEQLSDVTVTFKQNLLLVFDTVFTNGNLTSGQKLGYLHAVCQHTGDVWKCMDFSLTRAKYHFRTSQKRLLVKLLESYPAEDFRGNLILSNKKSERTLLMLKFIDYNEYSRKPEYAKAVADLRNGRLRSWESGVKFLVSRRDEEALDVYAGRPGMMLRHLTYLMRNGYKARDIYDKLLPLADKLKTQTLVSLLNFFSSDDFAAQSNDRFGEALVIRQMLAPLLSARLAANETAIKGKKIFVDGTGYDFDLSSIRVSDKSDEGGYIRSGLAYKIPEDVHRLRFFIYWNDEQRVDVDLHGAAIGTDGKQLRIGWDSDFKNGMMVFSGDITHSDAAEYFDIDLDAAKGVVDNVTANINLFSGYPTFREIDTCFVGVMAVEKTGADVQLYDPANCFFVHYLKSKCRFMNYGYVDVTNRAIVFDGTTGDSRDYYSTKKRTDNFSLSEYLKLLFEAQKAQRVPTREEADAVLVVAKPSAENELSLIDNNFFME